MFSKEQKIFLAGEVEKLILGLNHPEMPKERPDFNIHINGINEWSWADIEPNHLYENKEPFLEEGDTFEMNHFSSNMFC